MYNHPYYKKGFIKINYIQQNVRVSKKQNKFQILKPLELESRPTQRQLSNDLGVKLGKINYCLKKALLKKVLSRLIILETVITKPKYSYLLTPKGIEEKAKLTLDFIRIKTQEYNTLKQEAMNMDRNLL